MNKQNALTVKDLFDDYIVAFATLNASFYFQINDFFRTKLYQDWEIVPRS